MLGELERQLAALQQGDHICPIIESAAERLAVAAPFIKQGLARGERCLYVVADDRTAEELIEALAGSGVDVARARETGALRLLTRRDTYLPSGEFVPQAMVEFLRRSESEALAEGFSGMRLAAEMTWALGPEVGCNRLIEYEALLNDFLANSRSVVLCQYDRARFDPSVVLDVLRTHPVAVLGEQVCPNLFYEPPQMLLSEVADAERVEWKTAQLKRARAAEQTSQQRHALLRAVVEGTIDALFLKDLHGKYLMINSAGARFLGKSVEEVLGKDDTELFTLETAAPIMEDDRRVMQSGITQTREHIGTAAGVTRIYLATKSVYRDPEGRIAGIIGTARDITEAKRLEAERDRLLERLRLQIDRLPLAYILMDSDFRVLDWNPAAEAMFGYSKAEALGRVCMELVNVPPLDQRLQELVRRIESGDMSVHSINDNRTKDGRSITCEWFNTPLMDSEGVFGGVISLAEDITERKRLEDMLDASRRRFQAVFENALDAILLMDDSGRYVDGNPAVCELLGYSREELVQLSVADVTPAENRARIPELFKEFLSSGTLSGEYTLLCKGGTTRDVEFRSAANILPGLHLAIHRDITERKRAEKALRDHAENLRVLSRRVVEVQEEERRHLARELHDEIGQVLSAVSVNLQSLKGICDDLAGPRLEDSISVVDGAIQQVRNLSLDLRPSMLDDLGLVSTLRWYADRRANRAGYTLHFDVESSGTRLSTELATTCYRVVQEALTNVARHAQAHEVWLEYRENEEEVQLVIRDDGVGFDVISVRQRAAQGASFGVLGMQERVELLGGTIEIDSKPGQGTTIRVRLPINPTDPPHTA